MTEGATEQDQGVGGVSHRVVAWLAWSLWALCLALAAFGLVGALIIWRRSGNALGWIIGDR